MDEDNIMILQSFLDFKAEHGSSNPTPTTIASLHESIQGSLNYQLTVDQLYNRLQELKKNYYRVVDASGTGSCSTEYDHTFFYLAVKAWGEKTVDENMAEAEQVTVAHNDIKNDEVMKEKEDEEEIDEDEDEEEEEEEKEDSDNDDDNEMDDKEFESIFKTYKYLVHGLNDTYKDESISLATLKLVTKKMDKEEAKEMENKYRLHCISKLKMEARIRKTQSEFTEALVDA